MEGRIGILIDGVPSALVVPCIFAEYFQTMDDYSNRPYFAFFTRMLKFAAFFIAMFLPGFYTALGTYDPEMFPTLTLNKIAISIGSTPLSLTAETIMILLVYEIMRESGLRMPQPLGYAVSIVGGLVIGDTAINAGLIGAPTLMVVAISAICSYIIPDLYAPTAVLRIVFFSHRRIVRNMGNGCCYVYSVCQSMQQKKLRYSLYVACYTIRCNGTQGCYFPCRMEKTFLQKCKGTEYARSAHGGDVNAAGR